MANRNDKDLNFLRKLEKLKVSPIKKETYTSPLDQDVMRVTGGSIEPEPVTRIKNMTDKIDTKQISKISSPNDVARKIAEFREAKLAGKKALSALPLAGGAIAALSGDPALAAEELVQDAMGPAGLAYESIRPEIAGNPEDDQMMFAEREALENYANSPAAKDARFAKIRASLGKK